MTDLLLLLAPSANRVYAGAARDLVAAETRLLAGAICEGAVEVEPLDLAGVQYLSVRGDDVPGLSRVLSNLSASAAIFQRVGELLRPVPLTRRDIYPDDLVTIPKYSGKTNEQWTRLGLGVTTAATGRAGRWVDGALDVLDPMCGRGTTLNIALSLGHNATGVDLDRKDHEAYSAFLKTWMRSHRYKHTVRDGALRTDGRTRGREVRVEIAPTREDFKAGLVQRVDHFSTDCRDLSGIVRSRSMDVIFADTPYGVQHGSQGDGLSRTPLELLEQALPEWVRVLRSGGAIGLSFNRHVAPREELSDLLSAEGLSVRTGPGWDDLRHRVDASIDRDLIVASRG